MGVPVQKAAVATAMALLAGCVSTAEVSTVDATSAASSRPTVIALLDTGINPYHEIYFADVIGLHGVAAVEFALSNEGTKRERFERDEQAWMSNELGQLYHFVGTRVYAISFDQNTRWPNWDSYGHGGGTAFLAAREAPNAVLVMVQTSGAACVPPTDCLVDPSAADGMEWIADQAWIDVVSVSMNTYANHPDAAEIHPEYARYVAATERAAQSGKLLVNSGGNYVLGSPTGYFSGPPWMIAVGGVQYENSGEATASGKGIDVVANFTDQAPSYENMTWRSGTSFATPIVAGTLASAIDLIRASRPDAPVTHQELRDALNATGIYFDVTDWDPAPRDHGPPVFGLLDASSLPVLTQRQMGWGYIDGSMAPEIARRVLEGDLAPPAEKQQAILFQAQYQRAREEYWATWPR